MRLSMANAWNRLNRLFEAVRFVSARLCRCVDTSRHRRVTHEMHPQNAGPNRCAFVGKTQHSFDATSRG